MATKHPKVIERKLGRHRAVGIAYTDDNEIHIDTRQSGKDMLDTYIHEYNHIIHKNMSEKEVKRISTRMANYLWKQGYRKTVLK